MRTVGQTAPANPCYPFSSVNESAALGDQRRDETKVAVHADEAVMLDENFQASHPMPLDPYDGARGDRRHGRSHRSRQINAVVKRPGKRLVGQRAGTERRRYAGRCDRQKHGGLPEPPWRRL